jgi:hypothetical protein
MMQHESSRSEEALRSSWPWVLTAVTLAAVLLTGCSIKKLAVNKIGDSLAKSGTTFSADDDPDLIRDALPFSLKLMESLLVESPKHRGLLFAASSGFTQYAYIWVQQPAEQIEAQDLAKRQRVAPGTSRRIANSPLSASPVHEVRFSD